MKLRIWRIVFSTLVLLSLVLNGVLLNSLLQVRSQLRSALIAARNALSVREHEPWTLEVDVDQDVPIRTTIPIEQTFIVPLEIEYPLSTVVNTSIEIPLLGEQELALPINATIPISYTLEIPVQTEIPISLTYRLQTEIPVDVEIPSEFYESINEMIDQLDEDLQLNLEEPPSDL